MIIDYFQKLVLKKSLYPKDAHLIVFNKFNFNYLFAEAMAVMVQKIGEDLGEDFLFDVGYKAGDNTKEEMFDKMKTNLNSVPKNLQIIKSMCEVLGFGRFDVDKLSPEKGIMSLKVYHNPVIDASVKFFGKDSKVGSLYRGIYSIHADKQLKVKNCMFIETKSVCRGDQYNEWSCGILKR